MSEIIFSIAGQLTIIHWSAGGWAYDTNFFFFPKYVKTLSWHSQISYNFLL